MFNSIFLKIRKDQKRENKCKRIRADSRKSHRSHLQQCKFVNLFLSLF
jgi:hypothetical protein